MKVSDVVWTRVAFNPQAVCGDCGWKMAGSGVNTAAKRHAAIHEGHVVVMEQSTRTVYGRHA